MKQLLLHYNWFFISLLGILLSLLLLCAGFSYLATQCELWLLVVSSIAMYAHRVTLKKETRECVLVILHVLPRTGSLDHFEVYSNDIMPNAKSLLMLKTVLAEMETEGLVTITQDSRLRGSGRWQYHPLRVMLTQDGHAAARELAQRS